MSRTPTILLAAVVTLALAGIAVLAADSVYERVDRSRAAEFTPLVGGLGFGPALDLSQCEFSFDARIEADCSWNTSPIPGGYYLCPYHASSIFYYSRHNERSGEVQLVDAKVP